MRKMLAFLWIMLMSLPSISKTAFAEQKGSDAPKRSQKELRRQALFKEKVEFLGAGALVRATVRGSAINREGEIGEMTAEDFTLKMEDRNLPIQYSQLETLHLMQTMYNTSGRPDPVQARRVAYEIGIGNKARLELADGRIFNGTIRSFEKEAFVINAKGDPQPVKFSDVRRLQKSSMPAWGKALLTVGIAVGILLVIVGIGVATE